LVRVGDEDDVPFPDGSCLDPVSFLVGVAMHAPTGKNERDLVEYEACEFKCETQFLVTYLSERSEKI